MNCPRGGQSMPMASRPESSGVGLLARRKGEQGTGLEQCIASDRGVCGDSALGGVVDDPC